MSAGLTHASGSGLKRTIPKELFIPYHPSIHFQFPFAYTLLSTNSSLSTTILYANTKENQFSLFSEPLMIAAGHHPVVQAYDHANTC